MGVGKKAEAVATVVAAVDQARVREPREPRRVEEAYAQQTTLEYGYKEHISATKVAEQPPRPASGAGTAPGPTQEAPPCWPPSGRPANLSRAGPASFPFSRPGNSAGARRMAASASFYTHDAPETQPLRTDCLRVPAGKGL